MRRLFWYITVFGIEGIKLAFFAAIYKTPVMLSVYSKEISSRVFLRTKTSDLAVFEKVLMRGEYKLPEDLNPKVIVDAGANIGFSSLYFSSRYPDAHVIAVEPETSNFEMLKANTANHRNILPVRAAIWCKNAPVSLCGETNSDFQVAVADRNSDAVEGITIDELMRRFSMDYIDVMKVDIEGAEKEVFESSADWIDKVGMLVIELHDRFKPGCGDAVRKATTTFKTSWERGENSFFVRGRYMNI